MEKIKLSRRMAAIADLVPRGSVCADVGTDHGCIPAWLVQNGICPRTIATDINPGPLESAKRTAAAAGTADRTDFYLCSGLNGCPDDSADTIIIAGMGGETIVSVLRSAPWVLRSEVLILQPQSKQEILRQWLTENGYLITGEHLVDDGRIYQLITAKGGKNTYRYSRAEFHLGAFDQISDHPLFARYLKSETERVKNVISGLSSSERPDYSRIESETELLAQYSAMADALSRSFNTQQRIGGPYEYCK